MNMKWDDEINMKWWWWNEKWDGTQGQHGRQILIATREKEGWVGSGNLASCGEAQRFLLLSNTTARFFNVRWTWHLSQHGVPIKSKWQMCAVVWDHLPIRLEAELEYSLHLRDCSCFLINCLSKIAYWNHPKWNVREYQDASSNASDESQLYFCPDMDLIWFDLIESFQQRKDLKKFCFAT